MPSLGRVFGLKDFVAPTNCSSPNVLVVNADHDWPVYVSPGILLLLCYTVTSLLKLRAHQPTDQVSTQASALRPPPPQAGARGLSLTSGLHRGRRRLGTMTHGRWS